MLGLCFVLYEALDLFQGCYQHYHHSSNTSSSLANIEKHNKSVLTRANKIIKDIIVEEREEEEDEVRLIDEEAALGTSTRPPTLLGARHLTNYDNYEGEQDEEEELHRYQNLHEDSSMLVATIVPGVSQTNLGRRLLEDNKNNNNNVDADDRLNPSSCVDVELKKRLLLKMELLNEKSSLLRPQRKRMETTTATNNRDSQTIGDNESHFATNYICRDVDYEKTGAAGNRFIDSSVEDYEESVNMIRVFSVSECVL